MMFLFVFNQSSADEVLIVDWISDVCASVLALYGHLHNALVRLARGDGLQLVARTYELAVLDATGFRPEFAVCLGGSEAVEASHAWWSAIEGGVRSEERRVGEGWFSTCRSRGSPWHLKKKTRTRHKIV